jgi:hypothetical protein
MIKITVLGDHMYHCKNIAPQDRIHNHFDWDQRNMKYLLYIDLMGIDYSTS